MPEGPSIILMKESLQPFVGQQVKEVSGMTDNYATDLYRKIKGIDIGMTV